MSIDDALEEKIKETKKQLDEVTKNLQSFSEVKEALDKSEDDLRAAIDGNARIADEVEKALDSLAKSAQAIELISKALGKLQPEKVFRDLHSLNKKINIGGVIIIIFFILIFILNFN